MSKQRKILLLGVMASALFGFTAIQKGHHATVAESLIENEAQAYAGIESATCCPVSFYTCAVGEFVINNHRAYDGGGPCH